MSRRQAFRSANGSARDVVRLLGVLALLAVAGMPTHGQTPDAPAVRLSGQKLRSWKQQEVRFFLFEGDAQAEQDGRVVRCDEMLVWLSEPAVDDTPSASAPLQLQVLARGKVDDRRPQQPPTPEAERPERYQLTLETTQPIQIDASNASTALGFSPPSYVAVPRTAPRTPPRFDPAVQPVQHVVAQPVAPAPGAPALPPVMPAPVDGPAFDPYRGPEMLPAPTRFPSAGPVLPAQPPVAGGGFQPLLIPGVDPAGPPVGPGVRRLRVFPRSTQPFQSEKQFRADTGEHVFLFNGGINLIVEDLANGDVVDLTADRAVLWTQGDLVGQFTGLGEQTDRRMPLEVYLEGDVLVRGGNPRAPASSALGILSGKRVYVDLRTNQALLLDGSVDTLDQERAIPLFVRADEVRQLSPTKFHARNAGVTTSAFRGTPGYEITASDILLERIDRPISNPFTGAPVVDPVTGQQMVRTKYYATARNGILRLEDLPVFYWPYLRVDVEDPLGPLEEVRFGSSENLGVISGVSLDVWQLTGFDYLPIADRSDWLLDLGYYSDRGPAGGTRFEYHGVTDDGPYRGDFESWWILDEGIDVLGRQDERRIEPPRHFRGRSRFAHQHHLPNDMELQAEFSYLSDANLLESFFEAEYDYGRDQDTLLQLKQAREQVGWTFLVQPRVNTFLPQNEFLPELDLYLQGLSLWNDRLTLHSHSSVGYIQLRPPHQYVLPTDVDLETVRFDTRNEIDLPLRMGPWLLTPFAVGQFTAYSETLDSPEGYGRLYGELGVRSRLPFFRIYPSVESDIWNLHGLAHRVSLDMDYKLARANRDADGLPLLDQLDDDTSELVRRQNLLRQFGGNLPLQFDPRFFALRSGLTDYPEILDDLQFVRLGVEQRWQTKRGPLHQRRIVDWMVLDTGVVLFPEEDRDNFGELAGLIQAKHRWQLGNRTSSNIDVLYEPTNDSRTVGASLTFQRPPRASYSFFFSHVDADPFLSNYIGGSSAYRLSPRYSVGASMGVDLETQNTFSYAFEFSRIGLDFVTTLGLVVNAGRDDFGLQFGIVPRVAARDRATPSRPFGIEPSARLPAEERLAILDGLDF